ncbi:MAG TPA: hypothetical protein VFF04_03440 [Candidatus Babeliales bacterium]|nr:hypothetical protein [Candidatus Babeliales bacterium]
MKGVLFLVFLLMTTQNVAANVTKLSEQKNPEIKEELMGVTIVNNNNHKIEVKNQADPYDCLQHLGDPGKFKEFMRCLPKIELEKNLIKIDARIRDWYEQSLNRLEAKQIHEALQESGRKEIIMKLGKEGERFIGNLQKKVDAYNRGPTWTELGLGVCRVLLVFGSL